MKKIVVFGGGTGLSCLLSGLKLFPLDVTAVITVTDNGSSTGVLKEELDIPAVGDLGKVLLAMANVDDDFLNLLGYRFSKSGSLHNHPVRNIILSALIDIKGSLSEASRYMCGLLNIKGTVLPLTEERVELIGESDGESYIGEEEVSKNISKISRLTYDHDITIISEIKQKIETADLIVFSPGSLYTSILPHLIAPEIQEALKKSSSEIMYVSNLVTQPGETDGYNVSDHVRVINEYLEKSGRKVDVTVANNRAIEHRIMEKYLRTENKNAVLLDKEQLKDIQTKIIEGDILSLENETIRHNSLKTSYMIFSYLMD